MFDYSRFKGVSWDNIRKKWYSRITFYGKRYAIGRFDSQADAIEAYKVASKMGPSEFKSWYNKDPSFRGPLVSAVSLSSAYKSEESLLKNLSIFKDSIEKDKEFLSW